jgi:hypothetical protein
VIGARLPQRVVAAHAVVAGQRVHDRLVETVPHVQRAGDVGRRQQDAEVVGLVGIQAGGEIIARFPNGIPASFDLGGLEAFGEFHGGVRKKGLRKRLREPTILAEASLLTATREGFGGAISIIMTAFPRGFPVFPMVFHR